MEIIPVSTMDEVLAKALVRQPVAIEWTEVLPVASVADDGDTAEGLRAH